MLSTQCVDVFYAATSGNTRTINLLPKKEELLHKEQELEFKLQELRHKLQELEVKLQQVEFTDVYRVCNNEMALQMHVTMNNVFATYTMDASAYS